jgi:hypothetical protein
LIALVEDDAALPPAVSLPVELVVRRSTAQLTAARRARAQGAPAIDV